MTKDEFLSMLSSELENLEQEKQAARQKVTNYIVSNLGVVEIQEAKFQLEIVEKKVADLRKILTLPAYARIQAMSDAEIDEYKKDKVAGLELKIKGIEYRDKLIRARLSQLEAEQEQLRAQIGTLTGIERDIAIYKVQQLTEERSRYDANNPGGAFAKLNGEIEKVRKQQEQIKAMTSQEIKQQLSSKIKESSDLAQTIDKAKEPIDAFEELEALVSLEPERALQMAHLLRYYRELSNEQRHMKGKMNLSNFVELPIVLRKRLMCYIDSRTNRVSNPDKLMEIVEEFEASFEQAKTNFMEQYTAQKLFKLVGRERGIDSSEVDMDFLQQHADKLGEGELSHLQSLVAQRNRLSKKIFKTRDIKLEIESLNAQIREEQSKIYIEIIGWYESQSKDLLGLDGSVIFDSLDALESSLKRCKESIGRSEQAITEVKEEIQKAKAEIERRIQEKEARKAEIAQQIRTFGDERHKETGISYASYDINDNLKGIVDAHRRVYQRDVVDRVQREAQKQADIREAELRGVAVEQLIQMRKQAQAMVEVPEEVSPGTKR